MKKLKKGDVIGHIVVFVLFAIINYFWYAQLASGNY